MIAFFVFVTKTMRKRRRWILIFLELSCSALLIFDRLAYIYRGDVSLQGYWWVRVSNYMVYALSLLSLYSFNLYLSDLLTHEGGLKKVPRRLRVGEICFAVGELFLVFSQFNGWYYTFDETNHYQRGPGFLLCYAFPLIMLLLQLSTIIQRSGKINKWVRVSLFLFAIVPLLASLLQLFSYGISLTNLSVVGMTVVLYVFALIDSNSTFARANEITISHLKEQQDSIYRLFEQTTTAFVSAIDAKDKYSKGHSVRVANYAKRLAELNEKDEDFARNVYYAALLHEVGKIGVSDSILSKEQELTEEELVQLRQYPVIGKEILSSITEFPYLSEGAYSHHERYDGTGYPEGLKGEEIPEIARIISVADAYDTMTSKQSYREAFPQQKVREELVKGTGSQFDPVYAKMMLHLMDLDANYQMQEDFEITEFTEDSIVESKDYRQDISPGVPLTTNKVIVRFNVSPYEKKDGDVCMPALVLFDSLDRKVHTKEQDIENLYYYEYGEMWYDGHAICSGGRKMQCDVVHHMTPISQKEAFDEGKTVSYEISGVKYKDHIKIRIHSEYETMEVTIALPDQSRFAFMGFTGEHCRIADVQIEREEKEISESEIARIASEVSFINRLEGDVPNVQIDGYRTASTEGIPVTDGMEIEFHTATLPTARLVWHCPFINLFYSDDKVPFSENYHEYALVRLDGESWEIGDYASNKASVKIDEAFKDWEGWKQAEKEGFDVKVEFRIRDNKITITTRNQGIFVRNVTKLLEHPKEVYVSLTGDQVALTNIRIRR